MLLGFSSCGIRARRGVTGHSGMHPVANLQGSAARCQAPRARGNASFVNRLLIVVLLESHAVIVLSLAVISFCSEFWHSHGLVHFAVICKDEHGPIESVHHSTVDRLRPFRTPDFCMLELLNASNSRGSMFQIRQISVGGQNGENDYSLKVCKTAA